MHEHGPVVSLGLTVQAFSSLVLFCMYCGPAPGSDFALRGTVLFARNNHQKKGKYNTANVVYAFYFGFRKQGGVPNVLDCGWRYVGSLPLEGYNSLDYGVAPEERYKNAADDGQPAPPFPHPMKQVLCQRSKLADHYPNCDHG